MTACPWGKLRPHLPLTVSSRPSPGMASSKKAPGWAPGLAPTGSGCFPMVAKRLPVLAWLPHYSLLWLKLDLIAGLSVGLTVIPQGLAYAEVAGLPPQVRGLLPTACPCSLHTT